MNLEYLGRGLAYPLSFQSRSGGARTSTATSFAQEHIRESILQILSTTPGERLMNPEFGCRIRELIFERNDTVLKGLFRHYVIGAIQRWEKRVIVTGISFDESETAQSENRLVACISYRIIQTQVEDNLIVPFYFG
jgi:phage baseplate assembly protein W